MITGLIVGKFFPFHKGHEYAINFAAAQVDLLYVYVDSPACDFPDQLTRVKWIRENQLKNSGVKVVWSSSDMPQAPEDDPYFWEIWENEMYRNFGRVDFLFASEDYGWNFADELGTTYVPIDIARDVVPISGTEIREDIVGNFDYLTDEAKAYYRKKVVIAGPESTGKSTMVMDLSDYYRTNYVPEYGRTFYEQLMKHTGLPFDCKIEDMLPIAKGHAASIKAIEKYSSDLLFIDTDAIATAIFSEIYHDAIPDGIVEIIEKEEVDLTILLYPNVPHVDDGQRNLKQSQMIFFNRYIKYLESYNRNYVVIDGSKWSDRIDSAQNAIAKLRW